VDGKVTDCGFAGHDQATDQDSSRQISATGQASGRSRRRHEACSLTVVSLRKKGTDWDTLTPGQSLWDDTRRQRTLRLVDGCVGRLVGGAYRLGRLIEDGALCATYEAYEIETGRLVCIELLAPPRGAGLPAGAALRREARRIAGAKHHGLRKVLSVGVEAGAPFIVAEPIGGETISERLARTGPIPFDEAVRIALAVIDALGAAHASGLVHANLKPQRIRLVPNGTSPSRVVVMGLGVSALLGTLRDVDTRGVGTPPYLAPEQLSGFDGATELTDVWAVGLLLFEMMSGEPAFEGSSAEEIGRRIAVEGPKSLRRLCPNIPRALERIVGAALARRRDQRLSLRDLRRALLGVDMSVATTTVKPPEPRRVLPNLGDVCDDVEGTTDLHVFIETDLDEL